ncbi:MAG: aminopeptidase N [Pseudomonadota bacterium]
MKTDIKSSPPSPILLADYRPPSLTIDDVDLHVDLDPQKTLVRATLTCNQGQPGEITLDGAQGLIVRSIRIDNQTLDEREWTRTPDGGLTIAHAPARFTLTTETLINPRANTTLEGLYESGTLLCTQCEPEGFRCITFFCDRPDVLARYRVTLRANLSDYPVLLSNGDCIERGQDGETHWARFEDPFPKPSYLFAMVAGKLARLTSTHTTPSGRSIALAVYADQADIDQCHLALAALKRSMAWDERVFGLEYDLSTYTIVASHHFNAGAMENKGLNIFNTSLLLCETATSTDATHRRVESVIAHEYFHNWTGNRVTCRDWFQLTLKEGLTVLRDQLYSEDIDGYEVARIDSVRALRGGQFAEDAGPLAHPIRPDSYISVGNLYTRTVYDKGAEVLRMMRTMMGAEAFTRAVYFYLMRHDLQAVTCEDFLSAMSDSSGLDLKDFARWYTQKGTPTIHIEKQTYDRLARTYTLDVTIQDHNKAPIPFVVVLFTRKGTPLNVQYGKTTATEHLAVLNDAHHRLTFSGVTSKPVASLARGFSAPVILTGQKPVELLALYRFDSDGVSRWDAGQQLMRQQMRRHRHANAPLSQSLLDALGTNLERWQENPALLADLIALPSEEDLARDWTPINPAAIARRAHGARRQIACAFAPLLRKIYHALEATDPRATDAAAMGRRALRNRCLMYLASHPEDEPKRTLVIEHIENNRKRESMTEIYAGLRALVDHDWPEREDILQSFYHQWQDHNLVIDAWFSVQACARRGAQTRTAVRRLARHPAFTLERPSRAYALLASFATNNPSSFHHPVSYRFITNMILDWQKTNPQAAARIMRQLSNWNLLTERLSKALRREIERVLAAKPDPYIYELARRSLDT